MLKYAQSHTNHLGLCYPFKKIKAVYGSENVLYSFRTNLPQSSGDVFMGAKGRPASPKKVILKNWAFSVFHFKNSIHKRLYVSHWRKHSNERNSAPLSQYV
jgi:hypothetical protein